ncbi:hypothetical protein EDM00_00185 [Ornithobacterium rhinotracheale]|nr:hypothetical protein [Ornithobacterium rhinotracheale]
MNIIRIDMNQTISTFGESFNRKDYWMGLLKSPRKLIFNLKTKFALKRLEKNGVLAKIKTFQTGTKYSEEFSITFDDVYTYNRLQKSDNSYLKLPEHFIVFVDNSMPDHPDNVNLNTIKFLQENYPDYTIGYSDHTIGISTPLAAVSMGSKIIEKHITIDRRMKGTDQAGSLGPDGVNRMVRDIRLLEKSFGKKELFIDPIVSAAKTKLERSIASNKDLKKGHLITEDDLHLLSPGDGFKWNQKDLVVGKVLKQDINKDEIIYKEFLK